MIKKALHPPFLPASPPYAETFRMNRKEFLSSWFNSPFSTKAENAANRLGNFCIMPRKGSIQD
jgi:hypothetical protein